MNTLAIVLASIGVFAVIVFVTIANIRDRKKLVNPGSTDDPTEETRMDQERKREQA